MALFGPGVGRLGVDLAGRLPQSELVAIDRRPEHVRVSAVRPPNIQVARGSAAAIPLPTASVDLAVWTPLGPGVEELEFIVPELGRVLSPGGCSLLYDVRLTTVTSHELEELRDRFELAPGSLRRWIPTRQGRVAPFSLVAFAL